MIFQKIVWILGSFCCCFGQKTSTWRFEPIPSKAPVDKKFEIQLTDVRNVQDVDKNLTWRMDRNAEHVCDFKTENGSRVETTTEPNPILTCNHEGFHGIEYIINEGAPDSFRVPRYLRVHSHPFCYQWFAQVLYSHIYQDPDDGDRVKSQDLIAVWVVDYIGGGTRHMSPEELDCTALEPSHDSKQRSLEFEVLGNYPNVTATRECRTTPLTPLGFNHTQSVWYFVLELELYNFLQTTLTVTGQDHISRMNCFIKPLELILDHGDVFKQFSPRVYHPRHLSFLREKGFAKHPIYVIPTSEFKELYKTPVGVLKGRPTHEVTLVWNQKHDSIVKDACSPNMALFLSQATRSIYFTRDEFQTSQQIMKLPMAHQHSGQEHNVLGAAFTGDHLVILAYDHYMMKTWIHVINKITSDYKNQELPATCVVNSIRGRDFCVGNFVRYLLTENEYVVLWNDAMDQREVIVMAANCDDMFRLYPPVSQARWAEDFADKINITGAPAEHWTVLDAAFDNYPSTAGVLMQLSVIMNQTVYNALYVFVKNFGHDEWENFPVYFERAGSVDRTRLNYTVMLLFLQSADTGFIVVNRHNKRIHFYYKSSQGSGLFPLKPPAVPDGDIIKSVVVSLKGDVVILTEPSYRVLYGKILTYNYLEIPRTFDTDDRYLPWFDGIGDLYFIKDDGTRLLYYLKTEVTTASWPGGLCEYRMFDHNISKPVFYLDKQDSIQFHVSLTYRPFYPLSFGLDQFIFISLQGNTVGLTIKSESSLKNHYANQWITNIEDITITHKKDYLGISNYTVENARQSFVGLEVRPQLVSAACPSPASVNSYLIVGCLGDRKSIRVHKPEDCEMPESLTIPEDRYQPYNGHTPHGPLVVKYNSSWGCPIRHKASDVFKPTVQLYLRKTQAQRDGGFRDADFELLDADVPVNYVMYEIHGRSGVTYSTSMLQSGCLRVAQTFNQMRHDAPRDADIDAVWTPANYRSCFVRDDSQPSLEDLTSRYEVLNATHDNGVRFPSDVNGFYVLRLRIVDPNYSFCDLVTEFVVEVHGAVTPARYALVALGVIPGVLVILVALGISYLYFSQHVYPLIKEHLE